MNALVVFLGNFGPETPETLIAEWFSGPIMYLSLIHIFFDRSRRTLSVGGCAPVPLWDLLPLLSRLYPQMNVSKEMKNSDEELLAGLNLSLIPI